jgi:hypothetical protein
MSRRATISYSLALAVSSCLFFFFSPLFTLLATVGWVGMAGYGFVKYGRRAWPTLLGAPLAIYPTFLWPLWLHSGGP